jgi:hypothetical protein
MSSSTVICQNYDCQSELAACDAFYDNERSYCCYDCAFGHYYDLKKERRRAATAQCATAVPESSYTPTSANDTMVVCQNYDCQSELAACDAFYDAERPYCCYDCAFGHYYDLKKERRRAAGAATIATTATTATTSNK